jgi:hypothetical protein
MPIGLPFQRCEQSLKLVETVDGADDQAEYGLASKTGWGGGHRPLTSKIKNQTSLKDR